MTAGTDGFQAVIENGNQELLALHVSKTSAAVVVLELVQILVLRPEFLKISVFAESIKIGEHSIAFYLSGILHAKMAGVSEHTLNLLLHLFLGL